MRRIISINKDWRFLKGEFSLEKCATLEGTKVTIPHTWNGEDGQDGGGDYLRTTSLYFRKFAKPEMSDDERLFLEFRGVNSECEVFFNDHFLGKHEGGYSLFRFDVSDHLKNENTIAVRVTNAPNDHVYPQTADFTFYGGIYRDVNLIVVNQNHFDLSYYGSDGLKCDPLVKKDEGHCQIKAFVVGEGEVRTALYDGEGTCVAEGENASELILPHVHLWDGRHDPYLYRAVATLSYAGKVVDQVEAPIGFRTFYVDPQKGFFLNGRPYPLRGVARHQDRPHKGNAISHEDQDEDMRLIDEIGATTIRLAHYEHDLYFYHLCDTHGQVVWSEIPYISKHMELADSNAIEQMKELICQTYNNPSIFFRGISNEITMKKAGQDRYEEHVKLNNLVHDMDPRRLTTIAGFVMISDGNKLNFLTDLVSLNLYYGWYAPFTWLNSVRFNLFHLFYPNRSVGLSEYGAEAMINLHSATPHRFDNTEEYQAIYHEKMLKILAKRPYIWATHVWNMFDFGADGRNQGGDPGKNHKGLVSFDRKTKKDAFYIYKAYWSKDEFVHLCSQRFINRTGGRTLIKAYSNLPQVDLYVNDRLVKSKKGHYVFAFNVPLVDGMKVKVSAGKWSEEMTIHKVAVRDPSYISHEGNSYSWEKKKAQKTK